MPEDQLPTEGASSDVVVEGETTEKPTPVENPYEKQLKDLQEKLDAKDKSEQDALEKLKDSDKQLRKRERENARKERLIARLAEAKASGQPTTDAAIKDADGDEVIVVDGETFKRKTLESYKTALQKLGMVDAEDVSDLQDSVQKVQQRMQQQEEDAVIGEYSDDTSEKKAIRYHLNHLNNSDYAEMPVRDRVELAKAMANKDVLLNSERDDAPIAPQMFASRPSSGGSKRALSSADKQALADLKAVRSTGPDGKPVQWDKAF